MNREVRKIFNDVKTDVARFVSTLDSEFSRLSTSVQQARERYSPQYATQEIENAAVRSRKEIADAFKELQESWKGARVQLERRAAEYIMAPVNPAFVENLRLYKDFGLKLTRQELDALILTAAGSYNGIRALGNIAKGSGFTLTCPDAEAYSRDLDSIQRAIERLELYRPEGMTEIESVLTRVVTVPRNKTFDNSNAVGFVINLQNARNFGNMIDEIAERWSSDFVPDVSVEVKPGATREEVAEAVGEAQAEHFRNKLDAARAVGVGRNDAERLAGDIGRAKREANERAEKIMQTFTNKGKE